MAESLARDTLSSAKRFESEMPWFEWKKVLSELPNVREERKLGEPGRKLRVDEYYRKLYSREHYGSK